MSKSNAERSVVCFLAAAVLAIAFFSLFGWLDQSRATWPILILLQFGGLAAFGGGIGALFGKMWAGIIAGLLLPILAVFYFGIPC